MFALALVYEYIYLFIVIIMTLRVISYYDKIGNSRNWSRSYGRNHSLVFPVLFFSLAIGLRSPMAEIFGDTVNYHLEYKTIINNPFVFDANAENFIFDNLF